MHIQVTRTKYMKSYQTKACYDPHVRLTNNINRQNTLLCHNSHFTLTRRAHRLVVGASAAPLPPRYFVTDVVATHIFVSV